MFNRKNKEREEIDTHRLNEVIKISRDILKIVFVLILFLLVYLVTLLLRQWNVLPFLKNILSILSPLFIGLVIAWLFDPVVTWLNKKGVHRILATVIVFVLFLGIFALLIYLVLPSFTSQVNDIVSSIPNVINYVKDGIDGIFDNISKVTGYDLESTKLQLFDAINQIGVGIATKLPTMSVNIISSFVSGSVTFAFGLIIGFYMLFDFHNVRKHFLSLVPKEYHKPTIDLMNRLNQVLRNFVQGTLSIAGILFVCQSIGLWLAGMKAPMLFGLFCAITNIIPYLGPYIGGVPVVIVAFSMGPSTGIFALISVLVCQAIESYFLQPVVMGKTMKLHPVTIMVGLLLFGYYFGIIGMIVATPVISTGKVVFQFIDEKLQLRKRLVGDNMIAIENDDKEE